MISALNIRNQRYGYIRKAKLKLILNAEVCEGHKYKGETLTICYTYEWLP